MVPSKFYGIAAVGRCAIFIGAADGEIARLLEQHHCGYAIAQGDSAGLVALIQKLAKDPALVESMGRRARAAFETHYDKPEAMARWRALICELTVDASRS